MQKNETLVNCASTKPPVILDIRASFAQGISPCSSIDAATASLEPGQLFVLLAPFEPVPLFGKLAAQGFSHQSQQQADGSWKIEFARTVAAPVAGTASVPCCGH